MTAVKDGININVSGGELSQEEIDAYILRGYEQNPNKKIISIDIRVDGDYVDIKYCLESVPFDRIRRITGYLVGTLDRFNDAKRAEEHDRVKHTL